MSGKRVKGSSSVRENDALPEEVREMHSRVFIEPAAPLHTTTMEDPNAYSLMGVDNSLTAESFARDFGVEIISLTEDTIVFDLMGIDAPLANALRRILLAEIPTMAVEKVSIYQNTSIMADEVLAHRLGLVPIRANPDKFKYVSESGGKNNSQNTLVFTLTVSCDGDSEEAKGGGSAQSGLTSVDGNVYTHHMKWIPQKGQKEQAAMLASADPALGAGGPRPVHDDILLSKLRPGQVVEVEMLCEKGIGQTHAKWSPVATASYRLLPEIVMEEQVQGALADELVQLCPAKVFDIEDMGGSAARRAKVARPRSCTMCRECIRAPEWKRRISLRRVKHHYIFSVESVGMYPPAELLRAALGVLRAKCGALLKELQT